MKKITATLAIILGCQLLAAAQDTVEVKKSEPDLSFFQKKHNAWFIELGGPGLGATFNYERFIGKKPAAFSVRGGIGGGFFGLGEGDGIAFFSVPLGLNYNIPISKDKNHFLEIGGSYTFVAGEITGSEGTAGSFGVITPNIGWRHMNSKNGSMFRITFIPFIYEPSSQTAIGPYAGLSFGKRF